MIDGYDKPTLIPSWPELDRLVISLGPFYTCAWFALEASTTRNAPICSDPAVIRRLLAWLTDAKVIADASYAPNALKHSICEPLSWTYRSTWILRGDIKEALSDILDAWNLTLDKRMRSWIWLQLSDGEVLGYLKSLLLRHRMDPRHAEHILDIQGVEWGHLSLGRKRYVLWSSIRGAASKLLQTNGNEAAAVSVMMQEMDKRVNWLALKKSEDVIRPTDFCFLPDPRWRQPIIIDVALEKLLKIGTNFWSAPINGL